MKTLNTLCLLLVPFTLAGLLVNTSFAQSDDVLDEEAMQQQMIEAVLDTLDKKTGDIALGEDLATLSVPSNYYFLDADDARTVLVDIWGNPPESADVMGMLFPAQYTPFDEGSWAVTVQYEEEGYVSDEDAKDIDYDDLLSEMKSDTRAGSRAREKAGYGTIELLGWAEPPHYDASSRKLYWAKELRFDGNEQSTLNYDIRALGRKGVLSMTFIAATSQLDEINRSLDDVLQMAQFNPGNRYEDFDSSIDEVAAYGIGALVAGKVAAKAGLLAGLLLFLKKFAVIFLVAAAAIGTKVMGMFGKNRPAN